MTSSNLTPNDYIIVQRGNSNYRISGDQILNFSREQIGPELDELRLDLDMETQLRKEGDEALRLKHEQIVIRLEDIVSNMLPIFVQDVWKYKIEFPAAAQFSIEYQTCSGEEYGPNPINDEPTRCYSTSLDSYFTNLTNSILNKPGAVFFNDYNLMLDGIDAVFVNRYTEFQAAAYDWDETLKVGDYLQISGINPTLDGGTIKDHEKYAVFRITKLLGSRVNSNVTAVEKESTTLSGFEVTPVVVSEGGFAINQLLELQFMRSIEDWISEGYVSVEGDTMTGQLDIQLDDPDSTPALNTNGTVHANQVLLETGLGFVNDEGVVAFSKNLIVANQLGGALSLDDGTNGLKVLYPAGARYSDTIEMSEPTHLTHKNYVDLADQELENQISNLSDRVDGLANIAKSAQYRFETYDDCLGEALADWADCVIAGDGLTERTFQMKSGGTSTQSWATTDRILVHPNHDPDGALFNWEASLKANDVIEIAHLPTDTTPDGTNYNYATYAVTAEVEGGEFIRTITDDNGDTIAYEIQVKAMASKGLPIDGEAYALNYYDRSNGLSLELITEKFVLSSGDDMTGGLTISFDDDGESYLRCLDGGDIKFDVKQGGNLHAGGGLTLDSGTSNGDSILNIAGKGTINFRANEISAGGTLNIVTFDGAEVITHQSNIIKFNDKGLTGLKAARADSSGRTDALRRNDLHTFVVTPALGDDGQELNSVTKTFDSNSGIVTIKGGGARAMHELTDTSLPSQNPGATIKNGDVLAWDKGVWKNKSIGENYGPGQNIFVDAESKCDVGGLWTSGGENPSFYIRYK
jgi:hypothetical protein